MTRISVQDGSWFGRLEGNGLIRTSLNMDLMPIGP